MCIQLNNNQPIKCSHFYMWVKNLLTIQIRVFEGRKKEKKYDEYYTKDSSSENPFV